jgi:hypothetical protein
MRGMTRPYEALLSDDPAWPHMQAMVAAARNAVEVLPSTSDAAKACLAALQVTTRSTLGALAHETGGVLVDGGFVRVLGGGHARLPRALGGWNATLGVHAGEALLVGDDAVGGAFAINAGALGEAVGNVHYFAQDTLRWEDTGLGHSDWFAWLLSGDLGQFYASMRWPSWQADVAALSPDRAFHFHPPLYTEPSLHVGARSRRAVPLVEVLTLGWQAMRR